MDKAYYKLKHQEFQWSEDKVMLQRDLERDQKVTLKKFMQITEYDLMPQKPMFENAIAN